MNSNVNVNFSSNIVNKDSSFLQCFNNLNLENSKELFCLTGIVAEGIEDKQQESALAKLGCHIGQGYLYAKPMPLADLLAKLKERKTVLSHGTDSEDRPRLYR